MNKRILFLTSEFPPLPGGIGNHALNLSKQLAENNYNITVIADQRSKNEEEDKFDKKLNFEVIRVRIKAIRVLMYFDRLSLLFSKIKDADLVLASGKFPLWAIALCSYFCKKKYIAVIHGSEVNFNNILLRRSIDWALKRFTTVIAVSQYTKSLVAHLQLSKVVVIPNGHSIIESNDITTGSPIKGDPKLLTVGNVTERKGQQNVIKHLPKLLGQFPNLHYHCVGFPTEKDRLVELARRLGVITHISFHGRVAHDELHKYYKNSDIFIMLSSKTSTGDTEGFGIAILEANHYGIPAVGSMGCGIEDAILDGESGFLINNEDIAGLKDAITTIIMNRTFFSENAKKWAKKHEWNAIIKLYLNIFDTL